MPTADNQSEQLLVQYLLGSLAADEAERLDELSITDDDFAARLSAAENDLVDAYVREELAPENAERFRSVYASSPRRREKLRFAESLLSYQEREAPATTTVHSAAEQKSALKRWRFTLPSLIPQWGLAAAAIVLLIATGYLELANERLRDQLGRAGSERIFLEQQLSRLEMSRGASGAEANPQHALDRLKIAAFALAPAIRGAGKLPTVSTSPETDVVVLNMELEVNDFPGYRVELEDATTRQTLWTCDGLEAFSDGDKKAVSFALPAALLKPQNYLVQLSGIRANGAPELISTYSFRAVAK